MAKVFVSPYTSLEFKVVPFDVKEISRLYDIVSKRDISVVEEFLKRRISDESFSKIETTATKTPISFALKQFEFELLLLETLKEYTDIVEVPSITNPNITETYYLKHLTIKKTQPKKFYLQSVLKDYQMEKEIEKLFTNYFRMIEGKDTATYEKTLLTHNVQMSILLIKVYNLQKEFADKPTLEINFPVTQETFKLIGEYNNERPKVIDKVTKEEVKPRAEMFNIVFNQLTGILSEKEDEEGASND